jgi:hypothetical protein
MLVAAGRRLTAKIHGTAVFPSTCTVERLVERCHPFESVVEHASEMRTLMSARLLLLELGEKQRFFAVLGQFREVIPHAGLNTPAAGLNTGAFLLCVGLAGFGYRHIAEQCRLAGRRELAEMLLDARFEPALAWLNLGA